jgi:O-antigen/teichoic acid export membrane protein
MAVGLAIVSPAFAAVVIGAEYRPAAETLIPVIAVAMFLSSLNQAYVHASFHIAQRPSFIMWHNLMMLAANLVLMYPLVATFGIVGAPVSMALAEGSALVGGLMLARWAFPLPLIPGRLLRVAGALAFMAAVTTGVRLALDRSDIVSLVAMVGVGVASYAAAAWVLDVAQARSLLAKSWSRLWSAIASRRPKVTPAEPTTPSARP